MRIFNTRKNMEALQQKETVKKENKAVQFVRSIFALCMAASTFVTAAGASAAVAFAGEDKSGGNGGDNSGKVIEQMEKIMGYIGTGVGTGLVIFGAYEVVMAFLQQAPEGKAKGVLICVCGGVMMGLPTIITSLKAA